MQTNLPRLDSTAFKQLLAEHCVPESLWNGLWDYYSKGVPAGSFVDAVLRNDLRTACAAADDINKKRLWNVVNFVYNHFPATSWGSSEAVTAWIDRHHLSRQAQG